MIHVKYVAMGAACLVGVAAWTALVVVGTSLLAKGTHQDNTTLIVLGSFLISAFFAPILLVFCYSLGAAFDKN